MKPLKIVIVAGVIFPRISPRSFRATELAKALAKMSHNVTLMAPLGDYDYSDFEKTYGLKVKDIGNSIFATKNSDGKINLPLWKKGVIFLLRRMFYFPDICLVPKVKKAILGEDNIDLLITIAIPYSIHWGAAGIRVGNRNFAKWISDCGDPFMGNAVEKPLFYFKYLEKWWSSKTDFITVPIEEAKDSYYEEFKEKIFTIPQGFNLSEVNLQPYHENSIVTFLYAGAFYPEKRDPTLFLEYLSSLQVAFRFIIYTNSTKLVLPFKDLLGDKLEIREPISRDSLLGEMSMMDFLINIPNKGIKNQQPSKLIDYAITKRPVIEISSNFTVEEKSIFTAFLNKDYSMQASIADIEQYEITNVAQKFIDLYGVVA